MSRITPRASALIAPGASGGVQANRKGPVAAAEVAALGGRSVQLHAGEGRTAGPVPDSCCAPAYNSSHSMATCNMLSHLGWGVFSDAKVC